MMIKMRHEEEKEFTEMLATAPFLLDVARTKPRRPEHLSVHFTKEDTPQKFVCVGT